MSSQASNGIKESFVNDRTGAVRSFGQEQEQEQGGMVHLLLLVLSAGDRGNIASVAFQIEIDFQPTRKIFNFGTEVGKNNKLASDSIAFHCLIACPQWRSIY